MIKCSINLKPSPDAMFCLYIERIFMWMRKLYALINCTRSLPKTDELRGPGKIARRRHRGSSKDTEAMLVRPHKKNGRRKSNEESDRVETRLKKSKRKTEKPMRGTGIRGHKKVENPQLKG